MQYIGFANLAGFIVSWFVYYHRSGLAAVKAQEGIDWRQFLLPNLPFFLLYWAKMFVWPLVLVYWAVTGFKPSPWRATTDIDGVEVRKLLRVAPDAAATGNA